MVSRRWRHESPAFAHRCDHARPGPGRRRLALAIVILLPMVFYFFYELQPVDPVTEQLLAENPTEAAAADMWVVATGAIVGWAIAVAALFVMIGSRRADQSLLLAGYRPAELLVGRVLTVLGLTAVVTPMFAAVIRSQRDLDFLSLAAAIGLSGVVAATIESSRQR